MSEVRLTGRAFENLIDKYGRHPPQGFRAALQSIKKFQLELPLKSLFQSPTIAEMATVITEHQGKALADEELKRVLAELELMSEKKAQRLVARNWLSTD